MIDACGIIIFAARGVGECVVSVVYDLEFAGSLGTFWRVGGDAVGVSFECRSWEG